MKNKQKISGRGDYGKNIDFSQIEFHVGFGVVFY